MSAKEFVSNFESDMVKVKEQAGSTVKGFAGLFGKTMGEGALSVKQKELIAMSIGVAKQCEPCILLHIKKCLEAGATRDEILEAVGVAVLMSGGPAYTHIGMVINAIDEFEG